MHLASVVDELAEEDVAGKAIVGEVGALLREHVGMNMREDILPRHFGTQLLSWCLPACWWGPLRSADPAGADTLLE
jgi:hypothetical protein